CGSSMAAHGLSFESSNSIKCRKEARREDRERVLQQAKEKYENEERRKAERKARGEDTWMLPDVDLRLQQIGQENTVKNKKKKKEKKAKKSKKEKKKAKKEKKDEGDASCDNSEVCPGMFWLFHATFNPFNHMMGRTDGDNYTLDDMFVSSAAQKERSGRDEERQRNKAVQETRRLAGQMEKCRHCFDSPELPKHLIVAVGNKVYLCLPNSVSLTEGHCLIVPIQHHTAATGLDEDIWSEIQMFRRALVRMFESQELDCVFLETHMNPKRQLHMMYECVPLPRELGDMAPIYFKKAIMESDEEWAMNKKVVDLSSKDIRQAVPRGLPYFSVDFGLQGGFAHVIENERKFPHYFGKEILGGMLDLEPRRWRKPIRENFDDQRKKVLKFAQWWKAFDCTKTDS
uniref:CWF19-like protein 2 n=1 Tax=Sinocyclocheilus anshuiensis TaxID=1608454 RepID=A0A671PQT8_9TELE